MKRDMNPTTKVISGRVCTKYLSLLTMLRYFVASIAGRRAALGQLDARLHGHMAVVGPGHPPLLQQLPGIGRLRYVDPAWPLSHLDVEIVAQQPEVGHLEHAFHPQLELVDVAGVRTCDHQVVDVDVQVAAEL